MLKRKYLAAPGASPSHREASTRRICPLEKSSTFPCTARARLTTLYGDAAQLSIRPNVGGGVIAEIELPFERLNKPALQ